MLPFNPGGHSAYQNHVLNLFLEYYPNPDSLPISTWTIIDHFWHLDLSQVDEQMKCKYSIFDPEPRLPSCLLRSMLVSLEFKVISYTDWAAQLKINPLYAILSGFSPGDTPGVGTFYDFINRLWGSDSDLPIFPLLNCASMHDSHGFLRNWFTMKAFLPDYNISKVLLDSAHDAMPIYKYFKRNNIIPFIDLNEKRGINLKYKNDFEIGKDGIPVCLQGLKMKLDGVKVKRSRSKFRCPLADRKNGCTCPNPCSDSKYGRTVHLQNKDNPSLINIPSRDSDEWKNEYNNRTSSKDVTNVKRLITNTKTATTVLQETSIAVFIAS